MEENALGLYIHIPFCVRKCRYCDFLSFPKGQGEKDRYLSALRNEIRAAGQELSAPFGKRSVDTVFIGGGTPSVLSGKEIRGILDEAASWFDIFPDAEVTMEMNPGAAWTEKDIREACERTGGTGINRISLGVQSADEGELQALGRIHTYNDFLETYRLLRECGISNINTDLMFGIPGQTPESWRNTLEKITELRPEHISAYSLIIEEGTPFYEAFRNGTLLLPDEETERRMEQDALLILSAGGYERYEISNYAKPGFRSRHNIRYWRRREYLGFGLGASSFSKGARWANTPDFDEYIVCFEKDNAAAFSAAEEKQILTREEEMEEFMFLGLRMTQGVSKAEFAARFGRTAGEEYGNVTEKYKKYGLLSEDGDRLFLTEKGLDVSNVIFADFLHDG